MRIQGLAAAFCLILAIFFLLPACATISGWCGAEPGPEAKTPVTAAAEHWDKAMAFRADGQLDKAQSELELAIKIDPNMYQAYYQLGLIYKEQGQDFLAAEVWKRGLEKARSGPEREDYPRQRAIAQMDAALTGLRADSQATSAPGGQTRTRTGAAPARTGSAATAGGRYAVLYSSNLNPSYAQRDRGILASQGFAAEVKTAQVKGRTWHRVWAGCCSNRAGAQALAARMRAKGLGGDLTVMPARP
jgi:tetratricopeptide (TPR) repeat protein